MSQNTERKAAPGEKDWAGAIGAVFFLVVGAFVFLSSFAMSDMAAMFPRTIGAVMAALAVFQIVASMTGRSGQSLESGSSVAEQAEGLGRRLVLVAVMVGWALLFPIIGMFVTSLIACVLLMATGIFTRPSPIRFGIMLASVLVMVTFFYFLMTNVLHIPMPRGILF